MQSRSRVIWSGHGVTPEWKGVDNKSRKQPWPQFMHCASIFYCVCGCVFQENGIVARSSGVEWYIDKSEDRTHKRR